MVVIGQSGFIWAKLVVSGQKWFYSGKRGSIRAKVVVFGQICCIRAKVAVFGQKQLYSGKSGCIRAKLVVFGHFVVFGQK